MRLFKTVRLFFKVSTLTTVAAIVLALHMGTANATAIYGHKYLDLDGDGNHDQEDTGLANVRFELLDDTADFIDFMLSDAAGVFSFTNLDPGAYFIQENPIPAGFAFTTQPNQRQFTVDALENLVFEDGAANLPANTGEFESNLGDELRWGNMSLAVVPEPTTLALMGLGLAGLGYWRKKQA
jgi:hypothetical protein